MSTRALRHQSASARVGMFASRCPFSQLSKNQVLLHLERSDWFCIIPCGRRCRACGTFPSSYRSSAHLPATTASSDYCSRLRYWQFSQVPLQNFRDAPPPLPRRAHLAQIESARRCWFHEHRSADHAETFNETLCRKFTCFTARLFVRQDSRTSVALCTPRHPNCTSTSLQ